MTMALIHVAFPISRSIVLGTSITMALILAAALEKARKKTGTALVPCRGGAAAAVTAHKELLACAGRLAESQKAIDRWTLVAGEHRIKGYKCHFSSSQYGVLMQVLCGLQN